jgi:cell division protein FtsL
MRIVGMLPLAILPLPFFFMQRYRGNISTAEQILAIQIALLFVQAIAIGISIISMKQKNLYLQKQLWPKR